MQVKQSDSGDYILTVKSNYFVGSPPLNINFTINIVNPQALEANLSLAVIICCSILGVLVVLIVVGLFVRKKHYKKGSWVLLSLNFTLFM